MQHSDDKRAPPNVDQAEVERFDRIAAEWWDPHGKFRPLHQIGPVRVGFVRDEMVTHFAPAHQGLRQLTDLKVLDIGCGGGLVSEPLARLGAEVTGIDPAERNIMAARAHAEPQGLRIDYRQAMVEDLVTDGAEFDAVVCLEVVEHVPDPRVFVAQCAALVRPGGLLVMSTLNRTAKSFALAIVGAEYVLRWLPRGTHQWSRFLTPEELRAHMLAAGLQPGRTEGMVYNPLRDMWSLSRDTGVNYLMSAARPAENA